jgi:hypothetical protein
MKPLPSLTMRALTNAFASGSESNSSEPGVSLLIVP